MGVMTTYIPSADRSVGPCAALCYKNSFGLVGGFLPYLRAVALLLVICLFFFFVSSFNFFFFFFALCLVS